MHLADFHIRVLWGLLLVSGAPSFPILTVLFSFRVPSLAVWCTRIPPRAATYCVLLTKSFLLSLAPVIVNLARAGWWIEWVVQRRSPWPAHSSLWDWEVKPLTLPLSGLTYGWSECQKLILAVFVLILAVHFALHNSGCELPLWKYQYILIVGETFTYAYTELIFHISHTSG